MWRRVVERLACVDVAALPLQLLLRTHPGWRTAPVAVVEDDRPQALVLHVNAAAHQAGVRTGQRYVTALSIVRTLRAGVVARPQLDAGIDTIVECLRAFSPRIEPSADMPGVFWLDVSGFGGLYPSLRAWAGEVHAALARIDLRSSIAVGFGRFDVYALATTRRGIVVHASAQEERAVVRQIRLDRLEFDPAARDRLLALGIHTVGGFLRLPADGLRERFGTITERLHQLATGQRPVPLVPVPAEPIYDAAVDFDAPEHQVDRLIFIVKRLLDSLTAALAHQALMITTITLDLRLDDRTTRSEAVRTASPTLDVAQWLTLMRLRLEALALPSGIVTLRLVADTCPAVTGQGRLFGDAGRRDVETANQALARLRAECGERSVVVARLRDAHLPGAKFTWEPALRVTARAVPRVVSARPLVRRICAMPVPLPETTAEDLSPRVGPYVVSGGWWASPLGRDTRRDYYFVRTVRGEHMWLYYDHARRTVFLQGYVE